MANHDVRIPEAGAKLQPQLRKAEFVKCHLSVAPTCEGYCHVGVKEAQTFLDLYLPPSSLASSSVLPEIYSSHYSHFPGENLLICAPLPCVHPDMGRDSSWPVISQAPHTSPDMKAATECVFVE